MTIARDRRIPPAVQEAFDAYAALVRQHANVPACWDNPDRVSARRAAHDRFLELYEAAR